MDWSWSLALENTLLIVTKLTQCLQSTLCLEKLLSLSSQGTRQLPVLVSDYGFTKNLLTGQKSLLFILKVHSTLDIERYLKFDHPVQGLCFGGDSGRRIPMHIWIHGTGFPSPHVRLVDSWWCFHWKILYRVWHGKWESWFRHSRQEPYSLKIVKLCVHFVSMHQKRTQTDTKVTFHNTFNKYKPNLPVKAKKTVCITSKHLSTFYLVFCFCSSKI